MPPEISEKLHVDIDMGVIPLITHHLDMKQATWQRDLIWVHLTSAWYHNQEWGWNLTWISRTLASVYLLILFRRLHPKLEQLMGGRPLHESPELCTAAPNPMA